MTCANSVLPTFMLHPGFTKPGSIANVQIEIQIVDTHESLKTRIDIGFAASIAQFNRTLLMPSPAVLFASILFGVIGLVAFRYGKQHVLWQPLVIGIVLMVYPYFVSQTWLLYGIGAALCAGLYVSRE